MLELRNLQLKADGQSCGVVEIKRGTITVVLGRNYSGKSSLCRMVVGLPSEAQAEILLDDQSLNEANMRMQSAALVYQAFVNYPNWTVYDNIASPLIARRTDRQEIDVKVQELASRVRLNEFLERKPSELSGGQQQRLAIARALAKDPAVLVMDEPLVNIDYKLREELEAELKELILGSDICLLYATSNPRDAFTLGDQVVLLEHHDVLQVGAPIDVYREPSCIAAADLMSDPGVNRVSRGVYIRPEHVRLNENLPSSFHGEVRGVETNGAETYVHADVTIGADAITEWVVKLPGIHQLSSGEKCSFGFRADDALHLDESIS